MSNIKKRIDKLNTTTLYVAEKIKPEKLDAIRRSVDKENLKAITRTRNKLLKGTSVSLVVLSILTSLAFSGPAEITADQVDTQINQPPVVMDIGEYANATVDEEDDDEATEHKRGFSAIVQRFKQAVLSLPQAVRILVIVPLWVIGTGIMTVISVFWKFLFASPLGGFICSAFIGFAILFCLFAITTKVLFPDIPLKKIVTKQNVIILAVVAVLLATADAVVPLFWSKYPFVAGLVKLSTGVATISTLAARVKRLNPARLIAQ